MSTLVLCALASAGAASLRGAETPRRLDETECVDDESWHHANRGEDYGCAWVAELDARCDVRGVLGEAEGIVLASDACKASCGQCSDSANCIAAGGYPIWVVNDFLCQFPCGDAWTDCPPDTPDRPSPPCPPESPSAGFAVPSKTCLQKCQEYAEPFCESYGWPYACTSQVDGPFLNLAARCFVGSPQPPTFAERLKGWLACPHKYDPVCGDDDKTYDNSCIADAAGVTYTDGACPPGPCIALWAPVCGEDGTTYDNSCVAEEAGVMSYTDGECQ